MSFLEAGQIAFSSFTYSIGFLPAMDFGSRDLRVLARRSRSLARESSLAASRIRSGSGRRSIFRMVDFSKFSVKTRVGEPGFLKNCLIWRF